MSIKDCCASFLFACRIAHCVAQGLSREQPVNPRYRSADGGSEPGGVGCWRDIEVFKPMVFRRFSLMLEDASWVWHIVFNYIVLFECVFANNYTHEFLRHDWLPEFFRLYIYIIYIYIYIQSDFESKLASHEFGNQDTNILFISIIHVGNTPAWWTGMILH